MRECFKLLFLNLSRALFCLLLNKIITNITSKNLCLTNHELHGTSLVIIVVVTFYLHPKEQMIIIESKIEESLQIRQLNDMRYNMHKKVVHGHHTRALILKIRKAHSQKNL